MTEQADIRIRISRELLEWLARQLSCTIELGEPDVDGFHEPVFRRTDAPERI